MPTQDQLEVISPSGEIHFYPLNVEKGITNIGRHPDNDVILDNPNIAPFHAILDHRHRPYQIVILSEQGATRLRGELVSPNVSTPVQNWDTIEVDRHILILLEQAAGAMPTPLQPPVPVVAPPPASSPRPAAPQPVTPPPQPQLPPSPTTVPAAIAAVSFGSRQPDVNDDFIVTELAEREFVLDVEKVARMQLTIINGSPIVATFHIVVEGIDPAWVKIAPPQVNLNDGQRASAIIEIKPPRDAASRAGDHHIAIKVTSPEHPRRSSRLGATIHIKPFYAFAVGDLSPKEQVSPWRKATGRASFQVTNLGNSPASLRFEAFDTEHKCNFEFLLPGEQPNSTIKRAPPTDLLMDSMQILHVPVYITSLAQPFIGLRRRTHGYTVNASMLEGAQTQWSQSGQFKVRPIIGPLLILLFLAIMSCSIVGIFNPSIKSFRANGADTARIESGESVILQWEARPFARLRLESSHGEVTAIAEANNQLRVDPRDNTTYSLKANNFLTVIPFLSGFFNLEENVTVVVDPVDPVIKTFEASENRLITGETVTIKWETWDATELVLLVNGNPETLLPSELKIGSRTFEPRAGATDFTLIARNYYRPDGIQRTVSVQTFEPTATPTPTPTPLPIPQLMSFDVNPKQIILGQSVTITWRADNATRIEIRANGVPIGTYLPGDQALHEPERVGAVEYALTAIYDDGTNQQTPKEAASAPVNITVRPVPPTPTPTTKPEIVTFNATGADGLTQGIAQTINLHWTVTGDASNIEIQGLNLGTISQLEKKGSLPVVVNTSTFFILTIYFEGEVAGSQMVNLTAAPPPPPRPHIIYFQLQPHPDPEKVPPAPGVTFIRDTTETYNDQGETITIINRVYEIDKGQTPSASGQLSWNTSNAVSVQLFYSGYGQPLDGGYIADFGPQGTYDNNIIAPGTYTLIALNADGKLAKARIIIQLKWTPVPPPPYNFRLATGVSSSTRPLTMTWEYTDTAAFHISSIIIGFRVYRSFNDPAYPLDWRIVADEAELSVNDISKPHIELISPHTYRLRWTDQAAQCDNIYKVTAVYIDHMGAKRESAHPNETVETNRCVSP